MESKLFVAMKAFVVHEGHVLILRESSAYEDAGNVARYDVPGGRIKPGEHLRIYFLVKAANFSKSNLSSNSNN